MKSKEKMNNSEFKNELQKLIDKDSTLRPFVCDGYPLECEIFIVGINPATSTETKFFDYWDGSKFNKEKWFEFYKKGRKTKGKQEISPTRRKINFLVKEVFKEFKCLETNAYSFATAGVKELTKANRNTEVFSFLLKTIKPKALFLYGRDSAKFIEKEFNIHLPSSMPFELEWEYGKLAICATKHMRLMKKENIESSAKELISLIK